METLFGLNFPTWWFIILGIVLTGYAILDGFDFGAGAWHLFLKDNVHRRIALNAIGPVWDGNEVWLVIGFGAMFAGFPVMYASLLSSMYIPFILFLFLIIFRAVSIEFRSKEEMQWWRNLWDTIYSFASILLAFMLGVLLGNVAGGLAIDGNGDYQGNGLSVFLFPILTGLTVLLLLMTHGGTYLILKSEGEMHERLKKLLRGSAYLFVLFFIILTLYIFIGMPHLTDRLRANPFLFVIPLAAVICIANIIRLERKGNYRGLFIMSSLTIFLLMLTTALEVYPDVLISSVDKINSLSIYDVASSDKALKTMLIIVAIGFPLMLAYTFIVYRVFAGKVKLEEHSY